VFKININFLASVNYVHAHVFAVIWKTNLRCSLLVLENASVIPGFFWGGGEWLVGGGGGGGRVFFQGHTKIYFL